MFSLNLEKAGRYNVEGKAHYNACKLITSIIYDHNNNVCQASTSSEVELSAFAIKQTFIM